MYLQQVEKRLTTLLTDVPPTDRSETMSELVRIAGDHLSDNPSRENPARFSREMFEDLGMKRLAEKDAEHRHAMSAETPEELVTNLIPSYGHGE